MVIPDALQRALADRYRIERTLGEGGMATVYLAEDLKHRRKVALKVLRPELAHALGSERFLREITTTASLRHPHILPLYDSGAGGGGADLHPYLYYVMPYVEGETLYDRLGREPQLGLDLALQIAGEVAEALDYAHAHGVVHRDIKPANILLESGHAVVADFGIARAVDAAGGDRLTQTGIAVGTPTYMSPEQAAGETRLDGGSDLYSLGCVLYEMLAGRPPFTGPTLQSVVHQHITAEPAPVSRFRAAVPADVDALLGQVMAKNPADRPGSAGQFAQALAAARHPTGVRSPRAWRWGRPPLVLGGAAVLLLAAAAWALWPKPTTPLTLGHTTRVTLEPGLEVDPALSPDGELIAYSAGPVNRMQIFVKRLSGGRAIALTADTSVNHRQPRWSPDGNRLAFQAGNSIFAGGSIFVIPALGGPARVLVAGADTAPVGDLAWSPDGRRIAYVQAPSAAAFPGAIYLRSVDGGRPELLTRAAEPHSLAWSPDGKRLAFVSGNSEFVFGTASFGNLAPSSIWVITADGGKPVAVTGADALNLSPVWLPDGNHLLWISASGGSRDVYRVRLGRSGKPVGPVERLSTGLDAHGISLTRDGTRLAYAQSATFANIWAIPMPVHPPAGTATARPVTSGSQKIEGVALSRDGKWLAFDSDRGGHQHIFKVPVAGGEPTQLTADSTDDFFARWSPDGRRLAFHAWHQGSRDLYTVSADGSDLREITSGPAQDRGPDWSPDGRQLAFNREAGAERQIHTLMLDGNPDSVRQITRGGADPGGVAWSPEGDWIAYTRLGAVRIVSPDGGQERALVDSTAGAVPGTSLKWSPDGRFLYYPALNSAGAGLWSVPVTGGTPRMMVRFDDPAHQPTHWQFAVDDRTLYVELGTHESDLWIADLEPR
jgi:eukaryotic-like serine/threonine-protein kinase